MNLSFSPSEEAFRAELRDWLASVLPTLPPPPPKEDWPARRAYDLAWQRMLHQAGYAGVDWPREWGGRGATPTEQMIFLEETERAHAPYVGVNFVGLLHAGPTIAACGTPEQKARYLPAILAGEEVWCQGFSEPGAGSDLASLSTTAVRDGDCYVVSGQKIWTSHAQVADLCELLVRTDPEAPKHRGITWLIMDMASEGVTVRPLKTIGGSSEFSEVFLDEVRIPVANRVGEENDGWRIAMVTFSFERGTAFISDLVRSRELLARVAELASGITPVDRGIMREIGHLTAQLDGLWALTRRNVSEAAAGTPGPGASVFKLAYTEMRQKLGALAMRVLGRAALVASGFPADLGGPQVDLRLTRASELVEAFIYGISMSIAAGTSQIQRNIIAERVLGLPKEPAA
jgi:alkylation response protein AidB-like acyl-CoA dehydrogenase